MKEIFMGSVRAEGVAEILWELKRANKLATLTEIAGRCGFKAGVGGRTMLTCIEAVRRDWPHLQWWRAVQDEGLVAAESEQASHLTSNGFDMAPADGKENMMAVVDFSAQAMTWEPAALS
jgi:hypothetical protein